MRYNCLVAVGFIAGLLGVPAVAEGQRPDWVKTIPQSRVFDGDGLQFGQVVVQGTRERSGECVYDPFAVTLSNPFPGFSRSVILAPDAECTLRVVGKSVQPIRLRGAQELRQAKLDKLRRASAKPPVLQAAVWRKSALRPRNIFFQEQTEYHVVGDIRVVDGIGLTLTRNTTQFKFKEDPPACPTHGTVCITQSFLPDCFGLTFNVLDCHISTQDPPNWEIFYGSTSEFQCISAANPFCRNPITQEFVPWNHKLFVDLRGRVDGGSDCYFATQGAVPGVLIPSCDCTE